MTTDQDIQFGDIEETKPEVRRRPDDNKHFSVVPVFSPQQDELAVFVDLDAMRDMEEHALSDTNVELGGVMLGGQYEDVSGRPFVLVTDSLRAQHYESTKGSFKFTHDTWSQITKERDEFPNDLRMVGWYHTHPDWGVFLSGMDMFICDNFFNKPLDVALVIDPCRQDRGFFQWTGDVTQRVRRTGGFHLVASRFRQFELEEYVAYLEGKFAMSGDPRFSRASGAAPIINVGGNDQWQSLAMLGMLVMQFCFLMLLSWRMLQITPTAAEPRPSSEAASLQAGRDQLAALQRQRSEIDARLQVLDTVLRQWDGTSKPVMESLVAKTSEVEQLRSNLEAHEAQERELDRLVESHRASLDAADSKQRFLEKSLANADTQLRVKAEEIDQLKQRLAKYEQPAEGGEVAEEGKSWNWPWIAGGAVAALTILGIAAYLIPQQQHRSGQDADERGE